MESAKRTLTFYIRNVFQAAGLKWNSDNDAEVEDILQAVFEEAVIEAKEEIAKCINEHVAAYHSSEA